MPIWYLYRRAALPDDWVKTGETFDDERQTETTIEDYLVTISERDGWEYKVELE